MVVRSSAVVIVGAIASVIGVQVSPAWAEIQTYDFTVNVTQGALAGQTYSGSFRFDDSSLIGSGDETLTVEDGLTVQMNFFGRDYTEIDDADYPAFPQLQFEDGEIHRLDFWIESGERVIWWDLPGWEVHLVPQTEPATSISNQPL